VSQVTPSILPKLVDGFRAAVRRERLPDVPDTEPPQVDPPGLLRSLFARETLPQDPEPPPAAQPHRGVASLLFGAEPLPTDAPLPPPRRHHWIEWLLRPERIDER
jgi:hypothetical protein